MTERVPWVVLNEARSEDGHVLLRSITATCSPFWFITVPRGQNQYLGIFFSLLLEIQVLDRFNVRQQHYYIYYHILYWLSATVRLRNNFGLGYCYTVTISASQQDKTQLLKTKTC